MSSRSIANVAKLERVGYVHRVDLFGLNMQRTWCSAAFYENDCEYLKRTRYVKGKASREYALYRTVGKHNLTKPECILPLEIGSVIEPHSNELAGDLSGELDDQITIPTIAFTIDIEKLMGPSRRAAIFEFLTSASASIITSLELKAPGVTWPFDDVAPFLNELSLLRLKAFKLSNGRTAIAYLQKFLAGHKQSLRHIILRNLSLRAFTLTLPTFLV